MSFNLSICGSKNSSFNPFPNGSSRKLPFSFATGKSISPVDLFIPIFSSLSAASLGIFPASFSSLVNKNLLARPIFIIPLIYWSPLTRVDNACIVFILRCTGSVTSPNKGLN